MILRFRTRSYSELLLIRHRWIQSQRCRKVVIPFIGSSRSIMNDLSFKQVEKNKNNVVTNNSQPNNNRILNKTQQQQQEHHRQQEQSIISINNKRPQQRYDESKTLMDWIQCTNDLLDQTKLPIGSMLSYHIVNAEETIRYWTVESRNLLHNNKSAITKLHVDDNIININAGNAIDNAFRCFLRISFELQQNPELLLLNNNDLKHWYDGEYPRATHLLNAILDSWRIIWVHSYNNINYTNSNNKRGGLQHHNQVTTITSRKMNQIDDTIMIHNIPSPEQVYSFLIDHVTQSKKKESSNEELFVLTPTLNCRSYTLIMQAAVESKYSPSTTPLFCENILNEMILKSQEQRKQQQKVETTNELMSSTSLVNTTTSGYGYDCRPDTVTFTIVLNAWAQSGRSDAAIRAEQLFLEYLNMYDSNLLSKLDSEPNTILFNTLLDALVKQKHIDAMERAEITLNDMMSSPYPNTIPNTISFRNVIFGWANVQPLIKKESKNVQRDYETNIDQQVCYYVDRAYKILKDAINVYKSGNTNIDIDATFFAKLISTLARQQNNSGSTNVGNEKHNTPQKQHRRSSMSQLRYKKAEEIYKYMETLYNSSGNDLRFEPEVNTYRAMIIVYANTKRPQEAHNILHILENRAQIVNNPSLLPGVGHYKDVFIAWEEHAKKQKDYDMKLKSSNHMSDIVLKMIDNAIQTNNQHCLPYKGLIDRVFDGYILCQDPVRSEEFLKNLLLYYNQSKYQAIKPRSSHYHRVMKCWLQQSNNDPIMAAKRIEDIFQTMNESMDDDLKATRYHYTVLIDALSKSRQPRSISKCISAFEKCRISYINNGNHEAKPDIGLYMVLLQALSRVGDIERAMYYLNQLLQEYDNSRRNEDNNNNVNISSSSQHSKTIIKPTVIVFNTVILCILRSKSTNPDDATSKAMQIIDIMKSYNDPTLCPNERTYQLLSEIREREKTKTKNKLNE